LEAPAAKSPAGRGADETASARSWLAALFLFAVTVAAYLPAIRGGFIWDDGSNVTRNLLLRSARGLWGIWTKVGPLRGGTPQYYPLTFSAFWAEYHLWRLWPLGYHLTNVLLYALSAVLVWLILRRLRVPGALLAAAIFALHPVQVESVAWIAELKNVLSGLFYLLSLLCFIRFLEPTDEARRWRWTLYLAANLLFLCALGSKTVTATLPEAILLIIWWKTGRITRKNLLSVAPMAAVGLGMGLLTARLEKYQVGAQGPAWALTPLDRLLVAGRALWFYAGKLVWPGTLTFMYPRWDISQAVWWQYLFPLAAAAVMAVLWALRKKIGRGPLAAVLFFAGTLSPALGFVNVYPMRYSYVTDHFQYLACLGLIALFAAAAARGCRKLASRGAPGLEKAVPAAAAAVLLALGLLTWRQAKIYQSNERIWLDTLAKNPSCWMAHHNLGEELADQGKAAEAVAQYREALRLDPDLYETRFDLGAELAGQGKVNEAIAQYRETVRLKPDDVEAYNNLGQALAEQGRLAQAVAQFKRAVALAPDLAAARNNLGQALAEQGRVAEAAAEFKRALALKPDYAAAQNNWGNVLVGQGKLAEAVAHYREAVRINPGYVYARYNLGLALAKQGRNAQAAAEFKRVLELNPDFSDARRGLRHLLESGTAK